MKNLIRIEPVLPVSNMARDLDWYKKYLGFETCHVDDLYAVIKREDCYIHLQWHACTDEDPLNAGSVTKIFVEDVKAIFNQMLDAGTIESHKLRLDTAWKTHEFGLYDLNGNAIFFVQDI